MSNRYGQPWLRREIAQLGAMRERRMTWPQIARHFPGRTAGACQTAWRQSRGGWDRSDIEEFDAARRFVLPERTDLTGILMGDPRPGRSALERREARRGITLATHA